MSELPMPRSPLEGQIQFVSHPDVSVRELHRITQFQVIARKGAPDAFAKQLAPLEGTEIDGLFISATGPREFWVFAAKHSSREVEALLFEQFGETAALFDQSHGRVVLRIEGPRAADILARGSPLDPGEAPASGAAHTVFEHIPVLVAWRDGLAGADVSIPRSFAGSFVSWLAGAAR